MSARSRLVMPTTTRAVGGDACLSREVSLGVSLVMVRLTRLRGAAMSGSCRGNRRVNVPLDQIA